MLAFILGCVSVYHFVLAFLLGCASVCYWVVLWCVSVLTFILGSVRVLACVLYP